MARLGLFQDGQWVELVEMSLVSSVPAVNVRARARRRSHGISSGRGQFGSR